MGGRGGGLGGGTTKVKIMIDNYNLLKAPMSTTAVPAEAVAR